MMIYHCVLECVQIILFISNKKMNFKKANWILNKKNYKDDSYNFIGDAIINHENIFSKYSIKPESLEFVSVDYIIQKSNKIRQIIKQLDILLKFDGIFEVILIDNKFKNTISVYILSGQVQIFNKKVTQHDFIKIQDEDNIKIEVISPAKLFCISSPQQPSYQTYIKYN